MNVSELVGAELDAMVARANGGDPGASYSSDWSQGGPIIEREHILLAPLEEGGWRAVHIPSGEVGQTEPGMALGEDGEWHKAMVPMPLAEHAESALVAAMRVYVASRFGAHVAGMNAVATH